MSVAEPVEKARAQVYVEWCVSSGSPAVVPKRRYCQRNLAIKIAGPPISDSSVRAGTVVPNGPPVASLAFVARFTRKRDRERRARFGSRGLQDEISAHRPAELA